MKNKRFRNALRVVAASLLGLYLVLLFIANATPARHYLADVAASYLHDKLHTKVSIESVELGLFNRLTLRNVYIEDQKKKPLLKAKLISAKIELRSIFRESLNLRTVSLIETETNLYKEKKDSPANFQFVIDAFKSKKRGEEKSLNLRLGSLIIRRSHIRYDELYKPLTPGTLNPSHLNISAINANVSLKCLSADSLNLRVRSLSFKERSGIDLRALRFRLMANAKGCSLNDFSLELPNSKFYEESLTIAYNAKAKGSLLNSLRLSGSLHDAVVSPRDLSFVWPRLKMLDGTFLLSLRFGISPNSIAIPFVSVKSDDGSFTLSGNTHISRKGSRLAEVLARVDNLQADSTFIKAVAKMSTDKVKIPAFLLIMPRVKFNGSMKYAPKSTNFAAGTLTSAAGDLYASLRWKGLSYSIQASSPEFQPSTFLANEKLPSRVSFTLDSHVDLHPGRPASGDVSAIVNSLAYRGHVYERITANASFLPDGKLSVKAEVSDPLLSFKADASALLLGKSFSDARLALSLRSFNPNSLGLTPKFQGKTFAANIKANLHSFSGQSLPNGEIHLSDFSMTSQSGQAYCIDNLLLRSYATGSGHRLSLRSDFLDAEAEGPANFESLRSCLVSALSESLPALSSSSGKAVVGHWIVSANLRDSRFFNEILNVPFRSEGNVRLDASLNGGGRSSLTCYGDKLGWGGVSVKDFRLYSESEARNLRLVVQGATGKDYGVDFSVEANSHADGINAQLLWRDALHSSFSGELKAATTLSRREGGKIDARLQLLPTSINIGDTLWHVVPGVAELTDRKFRLAGVGLAREGQSLRLFGNLSDLRSDSLVAELNGIDIDYILRLVDLKPVSFGGLATGTLSLNKDNDGRLQASARLSVPDFRFNGGRMGQSSINGVWRQVDGRLWLSARMNDAEAGAQTEVDGYVGITEKRLDLSVRSLRTDLHFLRRYVSSIFPDISGRTTGRCRIYGPFRQLDFEGRETASASVTIPATGAKYSLNNVDLEMSPGLFAFTNGTIADAFGGSGRIEGALRHTHLKNLNYDFSITANRLLLYDRLTSSSMPFATRAFGDGTAHFYGHPGEFTADIDISPTEGTVFNYTLSSPETYEDVKFLAIRPQAVTQLPDSSASANTNLVASYGKMNDKDDKEEKGQGRKNDKEEDYDEPATDIHLNMQIAMNPAVPITVIMDQRTGDALTAYGSGTLRANFYNKGNFQLFGTYEVERGQYHVSLQNLIRKDFRLDSGGRITFSGTPTDAALNLKAIYTVPSASLSDLGLATLQNSAPVRVNCILNITGNASAPQVSFDLDLPTVGEDIKQMVRQTISTDEDMNMQIIYLFGIGRFYTYSGRDGSAATASTQNRGGAAVNSFLSSTLSSQLNDIISSALGRSSNWTLGTNLTTGQEGWNDLEVGGLLSGRLLNNRLLINGNFGYRDNSLTGSTTNFVGDFDINYLINPSGTISLKAYSETNDRYFSKSSLTTQGIGLKLQKDFTTLRQLFTPRKKRAKAKK